MSETKTFTERVTFEKEGDMYKLTENVIKRTYNIKKISNKYDANVTYEYTDEDTGNRLYEKIIYDDVNKLSGQPTFDLTIKTEKFKDYIYSINNFFNKIKTFNTGKKTPQDVPWGVTETDIKGQLKDITKFKEVLKQINERPKTPFKVGDIFGNEKNNYTLVNINSEETGDVINALDFIVAKHDKELQNPPGSIFSFIFLGLDDNHQYVFKDINDGNGKIYFMGKRKWVHLHGYMELSSDSVGGGKKRTNKKISKSSKKAPQYTQTSRTVQKKINGITRQRKVWTNKNNKEFVRIKVDSIYVFKKV